MSNSSAIPRLTATAPPALYRVSLSSRLRDFVELGKPRITLLVLLTTALGMWMARSELAHLDAWLFLAATGCLVASANTLNCWMERETDRQMHRTRNRALPAGRLEASAALTSGIALGAVSLGLLLWTSNALTTLLGTVALLSYVLLYTPLKRLSPLALVVGAVPGAIPPLMGWTAVTGSLSVPGWVLFGILFLWQLPHFIAISIYLEEDYRRGGLQVLPVVQGQAAARRHLFGYSVLLVAFSLLPPLAGLGGALYLMTAAVLGAGLLYLACHGLRQAAGGAWARRTFAYSLVHLTVLIGALVLDAR